MAIVLSTQSRLLVVLCGFLVVLAGTLTIGSFTGWFKQQRSYKPTPAKLKQDTSGSISSYPPDILHSKSRLEAPGAFRDEQNTLDAEAFRRDPGLNTVEGGIGPPSNIEDLGPQGESRSDGVDELSVYSSESGLGENGDLGNFQYNTDFNSGVLVQSVVSSHIKGEPGVPGLKGEKGEQGDMGPRGNPGTHCTPGLPGRKGEPGQTGISGKSGKDGIKGEKGEQGLPGTVVATNRGIKTITLKGNKGEPGKRGRRGKPGPAGPPGLDGVDNLSEKIGFPRHKGEKGEHGEDGSPGQDGLPGLPGSPGSSSFTGNNDIPRHPFLPGPPGPSGPPGLPGPPGLSIIGPKGEPGGLLSLYDEEVDSSPRAELPQEEKSLNSKYISGAVTFQDRDAMVEMSNVSPMGTLAYIIEEEALLVKVNSGWQNILLGSLLQITTSAPPSTSPSQEQQPFEAGNDIHNIPQIIEGLELETSNRYQKMLRMAALNEPRTGDMHGLRGADYACYREARRAGLRGIFRAFLSSRVQNIDSIVRAVDREFPVVNLKGDVLFHSWADMFRGDGATFLHQPRIFTFKGKNILNDISWPHKATWHGALSDGQRALDISCDAWHSAAPENLGLASSLLGQRLLAQSPYTCNNKLALLCVEATSDYSDLVRKKRRTSNHSLPEDEEILSQDEYILLLEEIIGS